MRKMRLQDLFIGVALVAPALATAQEPRIQFTLDSPFLSKYVWRGINIVDGPVWQPSLTAEKGGWSLNLWGNFELADTNDYGPGFGTGRGKFTEVDTTLAFADAFDDWDWSLGIVRYDLPNTGLQSTTELYASATRTGEWSPTLDVYADVGAAKGLYAKFSVGKSWNAGEGELGVSFGTGFGSSAYSSYYLGADKSGLTDFNAGLTYNLAIAKSTSLTLYGSYSSIFDKSFVPGSGKRDNLVFGAGVTFGF